MSIPLESLMGRYFRLKQELSIAYLAWPWNEAMIERLAADLLATEREIGALQSASRSADEHVGG